jgi:acetyl esterase/lipase
MTLLKRLLAAWLFTAAALGHATERDIGIVLMHGKWDRPPTGAVFLARELEAEGFRVATPTMPWSFHREYDVDYPAALAEIDAAVQSLRAAGATRILVGGMSFGANAALAYAGSGRPVDGVIALAPGHTVDRRVMRSRLAESVAKARGLVDRGEGDDRAVFDDLNQQQPRQVRTTAKRYLSYFDPEGLASMPRSAAAIPVPVPMFMAVGTGDPLHSAGTGYLFDVAPRHEKSAWQVVDSDHNGTGKAALPALVAWIRSLGW